jgi:hypothetical protein
LSAALIASDMLLLSHLNKIKVEKRNELLRDVGDLNDHEQFEVLGDTHPDFKYTM